MSYPYQRALEEILLEGPLKAAKRFAEWQIRCCMCGKKLTHEKSKVVGLGPECGKGAAEEVLANHFRPQVGRLHATVIEGSR